MTNMFNGGHQIGFNGGQMTGRTVQDFEPTVTPTTYTPQPDPLGGSNGGASSGGGTVTPEMAAAIQLRLTGNGGCPVNPNDSSAPGGISTDGATPVNPDGNLILTVDPPAKSSAMMDLAASLGGGPEFVDKSSWISGTDGGTSTPKTPDPIPGQPPGSQCEVGERIPQKCDPATIELNKGPRTMADEHVKPKPKADAGSYVDPDADTSGGGLSFPGANGNNLGQTQSVPSGLGLSLDLINSLTGGNLTFGESGLDKLDLGGKGSDIGSMSGLEALLLKFGIEDLGANLKDGSFDLDNFSAGLKPDQDIVLDLDGNGKQDFFEWAIDTVITSAEEQQTIADLWQDNAAYAEMKAIAMAHLAEYHIL